jgi:hypothetical protein
MGGGRFRSAAREVIEMTRRTLLGLAASLPALPALAQEPGLYIYNVLGPNNSNDEIYAVDVQTGATTLHTLRDEANAIADVEFGLGAWYAGSTNDNTDLIRIEPGTGTSQYVTMTFPAGGNVVTALEFIGDTLYAGFTTEGGGPSSLVTIDTETGLVALVGPMGIDSPTGGLAWDGATLYTVNSGQSGAATLYTVDTSTGAATPVGPVETAPGAGVTLTGLEFGRDGVLYALGRGPNEDQLFAVDPATGDATLLPLLDAAGNRYVAIATGPVASPCNIADLAPAFGVLDLSDVNAFVNGFVAQDPIADLNADTVFDLTDVNLFVNAFVAGCP